MVIPLAGPAARGWALLLDEEGSIETKTSSEDE
jgi:hypothetical protein